MKRINMILVAFALVLTMTQCKKNEETNQNETVTIALDAKRSNGSRVNVNTATGTVDFESGDKVYVGSGGKYVGLLTHNGTNFVGNITNPIENQPLQFYFLGNVTPTETLTAGTTESCSVVISDQTEHLPVISCAASYENYVSGVTAYSAHLLNKCALVKFNVTTPSNSPICITGMKNKVMVDFTQNTMTPSMDGEGVIMLPAGSGENVEKWAILLPQEALEEGEEGSAYSEDGVYSGIRPSISGITENEYLSDGLNVPINIRTFPEGATNGLFSVSETQQVCFSQGNLQYQASTYTLRFAENQWDYVGTQNPYPGTGSAGGTVSGSDNGNIPDNYNGWIDLFCWGTGNNPNGVPQGHNITFSDWGDNPISNGGNIACQWHTLAPSEWDYVFNTRSTVSGIRYAKANVNGVNGVILLPDDWNNNTYDLSSSNIHNASYDSNTISASQWVTLESAGAVFLPAAGRSYYGSVYYVGSYGGYWSNSGHYNSYDGYSMYYFLSFDGGGLNTNDYNVADMGRSVRLVCNLE